MQRGGVPLDSGSDRDLLVDGQELRGIRHCLWGTVVALNEDRSREPRLSFQPPPVERICRRVALSERALDVHVIGAYSARLEADPALGPGTTEADRDGRRRQLMGVA